MFWTLILMYDFTLPNLKQDSFARCPKSYPIYSVIFEAESINNRNPNTKELCFDSLIIYF